MITPRVLAVLCLSISACEAPRPQTADPLDAGASPNASILPAPLVTEAPESLDAGTSSDAGGLATDAYGRLVIPDAGPPVPVPLQPDAALPAEAPTSRDIAGVALEAAWRWRDVPPSHKGPEVSADGIREAQRLTALTWAIDLAETGRLRIRFTSRALPLPAGSELRARTDRYGAVLLWPTATNYRVIPPGALRTLIGERRIDVTPLSSSTARVVGDGKRLGYAVRKLDVTTSLGTLRIELGKVSDAGEGGALLCRTLLDILGVDPKSPECQAGEVPLSAVYTWQEGGGIGFEVSAVARRTDFASADMLMPPPGAAYIASGLPIAPGGIFLTREELAAFRTAPLPLPPSSDPGVPGEGFLAVNQTDTLMYLLIDGVPVVAVPPLSERYVIGTVRGRYVVQWRTFLGESITPPQVAEMPARLVHGGVDAGAPDGG